VTCRAEGRRKTSLGDFSGRTHQKSDGRHRDAYGCCDAALGEFRRWMREVYLVDRMPSYLKSKAKQGGLPQSFVLLALAALAPIALLKSSDT